MRHRNLLSLVLVMALAPASTLAAAAVEGTVTTEGAGIRGASIFLGDREVRTDNEGHGRSWTLRRARRLPTP